MSYPIDKLGNHIHILSGFAFKSKDFSESGVPVIKIKNITPPSVSLIDLSYVPKDIAEENSKFILEYDDVLIALTGSHINQITSVVGRIARVKYCEKTVLNQRVAKITVIDKNDCDLDFVYYYLSQESIKLELASKAGGAANQANISPTDVKNLMMPFPDIQIQRKVSSVLKSYDDLIENNQKQIKLLEEAAQRLYKEWFVDLRFPGHENTPIVDGVPQGWRDAKIGDCFITLLGGTPSREKSEYWENGIVPWINSGKVNELRVVEPSEYITELALQKSATKLLPRHTTIIAITGATLGQVSYTEIETCANQSVVGIVDETNEYSEYIYCYILNSIKGIIGKATGGAQQHINKDVVNNYHIILPDVFVLNSFRNITKVYFEKMKLLLVENIKLIEARDRLLPKLMSGELEV